MIDFTLNIYAPHVLLLRKPMNKPQVDWSKSHAKIFIAENFSFIDFTIGNQVTSVGLVLEKRFLHVKECQLDWNNSKTEIVHFQFAYLIVIQHTHCARGRYSETFSILIDFDDDQPIN